MIGSDGKTWDMWNGAGVAIIYSMVASHHAIWTMETRQFHYVIVIGYIISFLFFMPLTVIASEGASSSFYHANQWDLVFSSPIFYLTVFLTCFVTAAPRYIWLCLEHAVIYP